MAEILQKMLINASNEQKKGDFLLFQMAKKSRNTGVLFMNARQII
jgi:hypothetical protein